MSDPRALPPKIVFCDRLTFLSCARAVLLLFRHRGDGVTWKIRVLDPLPTGRQSTFLRGLLKLFGISVEEVEFFAGHLRTPGGEVSTVSATRKASELSFRAAENLLRQSPRISRLNKTWGRNWILLHLARGLSSSIELSMSRLLVASSLAHEEGTHAYLILRHPVDFDSDLLRELVPNVELHFYGVSSVLIKSKARLVKRYVKLFLASPIKIRWRARGASTSFKGNGVLCSPAGVPGLLLLQDADLAVDRSYRTEPHWLFPESCRPCFRTYILPVNAQLRPIYDREAMAAQDIYVLEEGMIAALSRPLSSGPIDGKLRQVFQTCALSGLVSWSSAETVALSSVMGLAVQARSLAALCERLNIRAFMSCDDYMPAAQAIQLVAADLGIHTLSYQYSNMGYVGPGMMTTADTALTFSSLYHKRWTRDGIRPGSFVNIGYTFDSSFALIRERACAYRQRLREAGARFIACYFDESARSEKYGLISGDDHRAEVLGLIRLLLEDPSVGLVVKTQYLRHSPGRLGGMESPLARAQATGRYLELRHGVHRNIVLPAEAALVADLAIGHAAGGTASLEAALVGARSIILNPYGVTGHNDDIYAQADIVYASMAEALDAIRQYRAGAPDRRNLGDWSSILHHFDPYRDGKAGHRMREILERILTGDAEMRLFPDGDEHRVEGKVAIQRNPALSGSKLDWNVG